MAISQSFSFFAHETWDFLFTITDGKDPIDLTGADIIWVLRKSATSPVDLIRKSSANGTIRIDPDQTGKRGQFSFEVTPEENSAAQIKGTLYFEVQITSSDDNVKKVSYGPITIHPTAIRS